MRHDPTDVPTIYSASYRNYYASTKISGGVSNLCTGTTTFNVKSISGATYAWTYSASIIPSPGSPTNTPNFTVQRNGSSNGAAWAEVKITSPCSSIPASQRINFSVGSPSQPGAVTFSLIDPTFGKLYADIQPVAGATSYNWYMNSALTYHGTSAHFSIPRDQCGVQYDISAEAINSCGKSSQSHANAYVPCSSLYTLAPNPASFEVMVTAADQLTASKTSSAAITEVNLYDQQGFLKKKQRFGQVKRAVVNLNGLSGGIYFIEIVNGTQRERRQLSILK